MSSDTFTFPDEEYEGEEESAAAEREPEPPQADREDQPDAAEPPGFDGPMLSARGLVVSRGAVEVLSGIDLHVDRGEVVAIVGPTGAGKTTFADAASGLVEYRGSLEYKGRPVADWGVTELVRAGLVQCSADRDLFGHMTVAENLRLGGQAGDDGAVADRLDVVHDVFPPLADHMDTPARSLSCDDQQLLAIGRGLMADPDLFVLDEPTRGLDPDVMEAVSGGLERMVERGVTVLLCEQNGRFAMEHADRVYLLANGTIRREGSPADVRGERFFDW